MTTTCNIHNEEMRWHYSYSNVEIDKDKLKPMKGKKVIWDIHEFMCPTCRIILYKELGFSIKKLS